MRGDKLIMGPHHRKAAARIAAHLQKQLAVSERTLVISISGESGSGKSELAEALREALEVGGIRALVLQQDDYFIYPPVTNDQRRREDIHRVGTQEVQLDLLDQTLCRILDGEARVKKPLVDYEANRISSEWIETGGVRVVIAEGTYTWGLKTPGFRVFIDRNYRATREDRRRRHRDRQDPFLEQVLEIEHAIIAPQRRLADLVVTEDFDVQEQVPTAQGRPSQGEVTEDA